MWPTVITALGKAMEIFLISSLVPQENIPQVNLWAQHIEETGAVTLEGQDKAYISV